MGYLCEPKQAGTIMVVDDDPDVLFSTKLHSFGMGLPLVKQIVTEHLGNMEVDSDLGRGTAFTLTFPLRWMQEAGTRENAMSLHKNKH